MEQGILDAHTGNLTTQERTKLTGVEAGATKNVPATDADVAAGTDGVSYITPKQLKTQIDNNPGPQGPVGPQGAPGQGVPAGGATNQVLTKTGSADYVAEWRDAGGGDVLTALYVKRTNGVPAANGAEAWPTARPTTDESNTVLCIDKTGNADFPAWFVEASDILMQDGWV